MNVSRSATAAKLLEGHPVHTAKSAGVHKKARRKLTPDLIRWADTVVVFEKWQRDKVRRVYPYDKGIVCLDIPDKYKFMRKDLIEAIRVRLYTATNIFIEPKGA